jgi:hypothetical protein
MLGTISVFQEHSSKFRFCFCFCLHPTRQLSEAGIGVDAVAVDCRTLVVVAGVVDVVIDAVHR